MIYCKIRVFHKLIADGTFCLLDLSDFKDVNEYLYPVTKQVNEEQGFQRSKKLNLIRTTI